MASPTAVDTNFLYENQKITFGSIRTVFQKFFSDQDNLNINPQEIPEKLWRLLSEESLNSPANSNVVKPEMLEVVHHEHKNLPGEVTPITNQSTEEPEQKLNESENLPIDKKEKDDKESKELKELKEKEKEKVKEKGKDKEKEKELTEKLKIVTKDYNKLSEEFVKQTKSLEKMEKRMQESIQETENQWKKYVQELDNKWKKHMQETDNKWKKHAQEAENKRKEAENEWTREFSYLNNHIDQLKNDKAILENKINAWTERYDQLDEQLKNKRKDYIELYKKNEDLKNEASQYQSALGDARNYRLGDNDANNPTQLTKEIETIQDKINDFCKIKGGVEINEPNLAQLLSDRFKCKYESGDKVLPKAALQHFIIETILRRTNDYITKGFQPEINDNKNLNKYLELEILNSTKSYLLKIKMLIDHRDGTDEVSSAAPKKIQQLVYAVLGDRGFGLSSDKREHEFVRELKDEIIGWMSQFRTIKKADKRKENEDMIAEIIRSVIKMFIFRIKVIEPPAEIIWIPKDAKVDPTLMEVGNLEDENYDDWIVNLCSFPLICVNYDLGTDRKVLVPAKIMAVKAEQKSFIGFNKVKNMFSGKSQQPEADDGGKPTKKNSMDSQSQPPHNNTKS